MQLVYVYLNWFQRNSLLKSVSQPKIAKKSIKTSKRSRSSKVIEIGGNREPVYNFLLVINSNLGPISHCYWDTRLIDQKSQILPTPSHLTPSFGVIPFEFMKKLYGSQN